ncbi:PREDICTED: erythroblast NAD(P)(+)--arginine ADP-ribosyltransferase-like [Calidris pugnax]|uniref:erythroblast NAD(P)(+)--arginine ADP-ribosyltransferase-like n=1 Tax=Calidris pugnax TaxID=198806 RepID=UPI00071E1A18|nr:PREDICTED: erythroblast NAD(P)(+)--arginine ADP-ribosyltransferase-like [Calidris pugnax]
MSMEHLVLALVLFAGTLAAGNPLQDLGLIKEIWLDMANTSFDDQYRDCSHKMEEKLRELQRTEFTKNSVYAKNWTLAAAEWRKREGHVPKPPAALRTDHAVALMAYTMNQGLYEDFNAAMREAGRSYREYLNKFHFKTLHFLLTQAVKILWEVQIPQCYQVYRGVRGIRFTAQHRDLVRFGQFTSTSFLKSVAEDFTEATFFSVSTCYGVPIRHFSMYPIEEEVLIPPFEIFEVTSITKHGRSNHIQLESMGTCSYNNCEWVTGKQRQNQKCNFNAGRTIIGDLPAPGRYSPGSRGGNLSPKATDATAPRRGKQVRDGNHHRHRDGGMGGGSIWGSGHGDSPAAAPVPS